MYTGDFSDDDDLWTQEWKDQVDLKVANDGIFWMPYQNFITYFRKADVAYYGDYKHVVKNFKPSVRQTRLVINNPVAQHVYITGELTSDRLYPRAKKCAPNNNVVLYFMHTNHSPVNKFASYEFIAWWGFGTVGKVRKSHLPEGKYYLYVINQNHPNGPSDIVFDIYASEKLPTIDGLP